MASPLGKYSELAALITAIGIAAIWLAVQVGLLVPPADTTALDIAAGTAIGILLGQRSTTNGAAKIAAAAHLRLDAIHAPPAETIEQPSSVA